jgi:hypothetical protein
VFRPIIAVVLLAVTLGTPAADVAPACSRPERPRIPDGSTATAEALLQARSALEQYLAAGDRYLVCLREFEERLGAAISDVDGSEIVMRYNAVVDDMYLAGDEFNVALRRFKEQ